MLIVTCILICSRLLSKNSHYAGFLDVDLTNFSCTKKICYSYCYMLLKTVFVCIPTKDETTVQNSCWLFLYIH